VRWPPVWLAARDTKPPTNGGTARLPHSTQLETARRGQR
jgi:hypothetical protein